ncbi:hypothetical protein AMR72_14310 [Flavobacterium psychrophilum]|nr:hypothetical protein AMR72_14310 [Flavobacterium psychrophilum]AOE53588.1 hypothetical protein ALW18_14300 [Flavobacterium psychrophilum]
MKKITLLFGLLLAAHGWSQDCNPQVSYVENFEGVTVPSLPPCITTSSPNGNGWKTSDNPGNLFTNKTLQYTANAQPANAWYFSKGITMTAGVYYRVRYMYGKNSGATTENLRVTLGTTGTQNDATFQEHTITSASATIHNVDLMPAQTTGTYYLGFYAHSDANQGNIYVDDIVIEPAVCGTPTNVTVKNVTQNGASVSWGAPTGSNIGMLTVYQYAYGTTNTPPADGTYHPQTSVALEGLNPSTTYYLFTRSLCGPVWSDWTEGIPFTTASCAVTSIPYTQDFESATTPAVPACTSASQWTTTDNAGNGFTTKSLQYTGGTNAANAWFFTQGVTLVAGTHYKISYKYGNNSATTTEKLKTYLATSPNPASVSSTLSDHASITGGTAVDFGLPNAFSVGETGIYYFAFNGYSDASQGNLYVDDIVIEPWTCSVPTNLQASNITTTSATFTWESQGNPAVGYLYAVSTTNTTPSNPIFQSGLSVNVSELTPGTTYYVFVKGICGPVEGDWSESMTFTTPACEATTVPYSLDFETATVPAAPSCTIISAATTGNNWVTATNPGSGFTSNALAYTGTDATANAWLFTNGIQLTEGTRYKISYKYGNGNTATTENLKVTIGTNPNAEWVTEDLATHAGITGATQLSHTVEYFTVETSGVYYFGFNAYSAPSQGSLFVDDFLIEEIDCGEPTNLSVNDVTDTTATVTWEAATTGNATPNVYEYNYGTTDALPTEGTPETTTSIALDELTADTQYYAFVRVLCGPTWSEWVTIPFKTDATVGLNDKNFTSLTAYPNPVKDVLHLNAATSITKVEVYSITGQLILSQDNNSLDAEVNLQQVSAGVYLVNVLGEGTSKRIKIVKQ